MKRLILSLSILSAAVFPRLAAGATDYSNGIFFLNEDWYGHQNSTVNFLVPDDPEGNFWHYRVIQTENPGVEVGCTAQHGALWHGRLYIISKQDKDPGADKAGGRISVADAKTLKILHQQALIDPSGAQCDGRGFLGVDEHKGYVSSSNGVWVFDLDRFEVTGRVAGTENPNAGDGSDKPGTDPTGPLYHGQTGMMVAADGRVFAAHQQYGLLVIDPATDKVVESLSMDIVSEGAGIGSIVKAKDGSLWLSVAKDTRGTGTTANFLVRVDPASLRYEIVPVPEGMYPPSNSWYAWTPDAFVASATSNCLYWKGGPNRWFSGTKIYKYDIDTGVTTLFVDLEEEGAGWKLYGCSMGVHPVSGELYMSLYHEFGSPAYITRRYSPSGKVVRDYEMIQNYWFPSLPVFAVDGTGNASAEGIHAGTESFAATYRDGVLRVEGAMAREAEITDLRGVRMALCPLIDGAGSIALSLAPGIYLVRAGGCSAKLMAR